MKQFEDEGLILALYPYKDYDLVVRLICCNYGTLSAIAWGARKSAKRFGPGIDTLTRVKIECTRGRGSLITLKALNIIDVYWTLKESLEKLPVAQLWQEIILKSHVPPQDAAPLYESTIALLKSLEVVEPEVVALFAIKGAQVLLSAMDFHIFEPKCRVCSKVIRHKWTPLDLQFGHAVCHDHRAGRQIALYRTDLVLDYSQLLSMESAAMTPLVPKVENLMQLLELNLSYVYADTLKSLEFLKGTLK